MNPPPNGGFRVEGLGFRVLEPLRGTYVKPGAALRQQESAGSIPVQPVDEAWAQSPI